MDHEHDVTLGGLLLEAAPPPAHPQRLVAAGMARGRRLRRRRRVGAALATATVAGAAAVALPLLAPGGGGSGATVATDPGSGAETATTLAALLPPGEVSDLEDRVAPDLRRGGLLYEGTRVYVYVYRATSCETAPVLPDSGCYDLAPGATAPRSVAGTETSAGTGDLPRKRSEADYTRPDGWRVSVSATNDAVAGGPVLRGAPALTWDQLLEIARADVWLPTEAARAR